MSNTMNSEHDAEPLINCRLRHGLNDNCLLQVFEYLNESDLLCLCAMDPYYKELILKWTIQQKRLNLRQLTPANLQWFTTFGKSMRRIKTYTGHFVSTIVTIMRTCEPGQLFEIDMTVQGGAGLLIDADWADMLFHLTLQAMPFFSNLRKFKFEGYCNADMVGVCTNLFSQISTTAVDLRSVEIGHLELHGNWLQNMRNLEELRITWKRESSLHSLISFLKGRPNLKVFKFKHQLTDVTSVYDVLAESCPNLETFSDEDLTRRSHYHNFDDSLTSRYAFFSKFSQLSYVTLTTYTFCGSDLYYPLVSLATKNIVKLSIITSLSLPIEVNKKAKAEIMVRPLPQFTRLKSVKLDIRTPNVRQLHDEKWECCDLRYQFLFHFLRHVTSLEHFALSGPPNYMDKIVEQIPTIRVLDLSETYSFEIIKTVANIVKIVLESRLHNAGTFHIILKDDEKAKFFKKQYGMLKDNINFTFTTLNRW